MMRIKFNQYERVAGVFVLVAVVSFSASLLGIAIKQGWFDSRTNFISFFKNAEGVHAGTQIQISGLRAGEVSDVHLTGDNRVQVKFWIFSRFADKVKADSTVSLVRPFILGDRMLDLTVGSEGSETTLAENEVKAIETLDFMSMMSGKNIGIYLASMSDALGNLKFLAEAFLAKNRAESFVKIFDQIDPLLKNVSLMATEITKLSKQGNHQDRFGNVLKEVLITTHELNKIVPTLAENGPQMGKNIERMVVNLGILTEQFKVLGPALAEIGPDLPRSSRRAVEALDEAVVLLKAMQKSFVFRSSAAEVREEEKTHKKSERKPAEQE
jgi:phospholipid/cholesterol/gamma-HCH transport system substrate-binding protein